MCRHFKLLVLHHHFELICKHAPIRLELIEVLREASPHISVLDLVPLNFLIVDMFSWHEQALFLRVVVSRLFQNGLVDQLGVLHELLEVVEFAVLFIYLLFVVFLSLPIAGHPVRDLDQVCLSVVQQLSTRINN